MLSASDTAYSLLKVSPSVRELDELYTPTLFELSFAEGSTRHLGPRMGLLILLKTFQKLGYFVQMSDVPSSIARHIAKAGGYLEGLKELATYDGSRTRSRHIALIRSYLGVSAFDREARKLLVRSAVESSRVREDLADITNVISRHDFFPFGEEILAGQAGRDSHFGPGNDSINQKFTGKERDAESGLAYFGARYYGGAGGRFTSVDPENAGADSANPQSWNGYSYVQNNPLALTDPDGRAAKDPCDGIPNCVSVSAKYEGLDPLSAAVYQGLFRPVTQILLFTQQTIQGLQWLGKPRNSTRLAASTAAGASAGAGVGALGLVGGPAVGITEPTAVLAGGVAGWAGGMVSCMSSSEGSGGGGSSEGGVAGNLKKLSPSEIKKLKVAGEDAEQIKKEIVGARGSNYDLFKTESGEIVVKAKDGLGEAQPTGLNIRKY